MIQADDGIQRSMITQSATIVLLSSDSDTLDLVLQLIGHDPVIKTPTSIVRLTAESIRPVRVAGNIGTLPIPERIVESRI